MSSPSKKYVSTQGEGRVDQFSANPLRPPSTTCAARRQGRRDDPTPEVDSVSWRGAQRQCSLIGAAGRHEAVAGMTPAQRESLRKEIDVRVRERMGGLSKQGGSPPGSKLPRAKS